MKKLLRFILALSVSFFFSLSCRSQNGFIVLNEYLPWPGNGCNSTAEFIEIMNFGPGPVDLGCYVVTDGDYAITIPPNTIIQPGKFFVLGGMDIIPIGCANVDSAIRADLNWYTCGCSSGSIGTSGDAFLTDGGSANEQLVLFDPAFHIVDAIVRKLPQEPSSTISINTLDGLCSGHTFNLDSMNINYEIVGESAGRGNSFARKRDGDCGWLKSTQQSGDATNNTSGGSSGSLSSLLSIVQPHACNGNNGMVSVSFSSTENVFPARYILAYDADSNHQYTLNDVYTNGTDSTGPNIVLSGLAAGTYTVVIEPASGCNYQKQSFTILPCGIVIVPVKIYEVAVFCGAHTLVKWACNTAGSVDHFDIEATTDNRNYFTIGRVNTASGYRSEFIYVDSVRRNTSISYRVKAVQENIAYYSGTLQCDKTTRSGAIVYPNPVRETLNIRMQEGVTTTATIDIFDASGINLYSDKILVNGISNTFSLGVKHFSKGYYCIRIGLGGKKSILKFMKQ